MRMRIVLGLALGLMATASVRAQQVTWQAAAPARRGVPVTFGAPVPLTAQSANEPARPNSAQAPRVVRGQIGEPPVPPPPVFPGSGPPPMASPQMYNQGVVTSDSDLGGFWSRCGDWFKRSWDEVTGGIPGAFQSGPNRAMFQSDRAFEVFSSPVTNPFFFEDPRALTEIRPLFIWQKTPNANPIWSGGSNFEYAVRGSVAVTPNISVVVHRLGFTTINPSTGAPGIQSATGFSELMLGPKFTIIRNDVSNTVAAVGLIFDIPTGSSSVLQDTGSLSLAPYFSIAQNFGRSTYGSFNFMNTTGYAFRTDNTRTPAFYSSFHLDYEIAKRFYPMVELNWRYYTRNGNERPLNFERNDLANFGSQGIGGKHELTLAVGGRVRINDFIQWGLAAEFNVLSNSTGQHLDQFRLTTDFIFRY